MNCYGEWPLLRQGYEGQEGGTSDLGRDGKREVVLVSRLRPALQRLNPGLPMEAIEGAVEEICRDRTALSLAEAKTIDLSKIDFGVLEKKFERSKTKNIEAQQLRALIERKLDNLIRLNASRYDYLDRFQKMIEAYNSGALSIEQLFTELLTFAKISTKKSSVICASRSARKS